MAKTLKHEELLVDVKINSNPAQAELIKLETQTRKYKAVNKDLRIEKEKLEKLGKKETADYKAVTAAIKENNATIKKNEERMKVLREKIGLTGLTMSQLKKQATALRIQLSHMVPGSAEYIRLDADLKKINARIKEVRIGAQTASFSMGKMADGFNRYTALGATVIASLTGMVLSVQKIIDYNGKLSDSQADVMKTTKLTKVEVDELTKSFGLFKTRTARIELLKLAEEAGRLGIEGTENVKAFVRVANQLKVALGDDLNETQIRDVGKLVETYKIAETTGRDLEGSLLSLGSAINEVSASGSNQAGFLVDFLKRTTGISAQVKLSAADNIGYAATFDELGQNVEVTSTTMNKLWADMAKNTGTYAKITNMSVNEFKDLLEKDANKAMITFLKALKNNNAGFQQMVQLLDDVEAGGTRGDAALSSLVSGVEKLEEKQRIANQSMSEATSLTDEYNIKNNNLAASLDKIKKTVAGWFSSEGFVQWLTASFEWFAKFIGATEDASGEVERFRERLVTFIKVLTILTIGYISYRTAIRLTSLTLKSFAIIQRVVNALENRSAVGKKFLSQTILLVRASYLALTGSTTKAAAAQRLLNSAQMANPLGLIIGLLATWLSYLLIFKGRTDDGTKAQKSMNAEMAIAKKQQEEFGKSSTNLKSKIDPLIEVLKDESAAMEVRKKAYERLIAISPDFIDTVDDEFLATNKLTEAYDGLIKKMEQLALTKARQAVREERANAYAKAQAEEFDALLKKNDEEKDNKEKKQRNEEKADKFLKREAYSTREYSSLHSPKMETLSSVEAEAYEAAVIAREKAENEFNQFTEFQKSEIDKLQERLKTLKKGSDEYKTTMAEIESWLGPQETTSGNENNNNEYNKPKGSGKKPKKDPEKQAHEKRLREIERFYSERLRLEREYQDGNIALMQEGYDKELQAENLNFERRKEDLKLRLIDEEEITKAEQQAKNKNLTEEQRQSYAVLANQWRQANSTIYQKIEQETALHLLRKATLVEKFSKTEVDELKEAYEKEKVIREQHQNEELIKAGNNKKERAALEEKHRQEDYEAELKHLQDLLDLYNDMIAGEEIDGIDFSLLTPEQRKKLEEDAQVIKTAITSIIEKKNKLKNGDEDESLNLGSTDILGFTSDQWEIFFENLKNGKAGIEEMLFAIQAVQNMYSQYAAMVEANEARLLQKYEQNSQKKQNRLDRQFNSGLISQEQYNRASQLLENDLARKKAELEYKQAKRKRNMDIVNVIVNTSLAIMKAVADLGPIAGAIAAVLMGTMGAVQLATIKSQPLPAPGFEEGLYPKELVMREQDGQLFNSVFGGKTRSGLVTRPTHFLTGENGPEMIIDSKAYKQLSPDVKNSLIRELRVIKGFEDGLYPTQPESNNIDLSLFVAALERNSAILEKLEQNGILAVLSSDFKTAKKIKDLIKDYENFRNSKQVS